MTELTHPKPEARNYKNKLRLVIYIVLSISCLLIIVPNFQDMVVAAGNSYSPYPGKNLMIDYMLGVLWAATLGFSILFWPVPSRDRKALIWIWLVKAVVALVLMLGYEYIYAFDVDGYFTNAVSPYFIWKGFSFDNGTSTTQQLTWLHLKIVPGSYHAAKVGFAMFGLVGVYLIYRAAVIFLRREDIRILYVLALFPSILFWSSILGKDPITLLGVSLYVYGVVAWHQLKQPRHLLTLALGILIVALIRLWLAPILVAPLMVFIIVGRRSFIRRMALMVICGSVFMLALPKIQDMWSMSTVEDLFEFRSYALGASIGGGSSFRAREITGFNISMKYLPLGIFIALFRPLPLDVPNIFGTLQSLDNLILLFLLCMAVKRTRLKELKEPLVLWAIFLVLTWAALYGNVIYNLGTLVRYKLQILPVLLGLLLYLSRRRTRSKLSTQLC